MWFHLATHPLGVHSSNHPQGKSATAGELFTKQLPAILFLKFIFICFIVIQLQLSAFSPHSSCLNKCRTFLTAPLSNQSREYWSQGPTWPNSSLLQVLPGIPISMVLASIIPADMYHCCVSPTSSLFPSAPSSIQSLLVLAFPPCSGRGGSWCSNSPPRILWQVPGQGATAG